MRSVFITVLLTLCSISYGQLPSSRFQNTVLPTLESSPFSNPAISDSRGFEGGVFYGVQYESLSYGGGFGRLSGSFGSLRAGGLYQLDSPNQREWFGSYGRRIFKWCSAGAGYWSSGDSDNIYLGLSMVLSGDIRLGATVSSGLVGCGIGWQFRQNGIIGLELDSNGRYSVGTMFPVTDFILMKLRSGNLDDDWALGLEARGRRLLLQTFVSHHRYLGFSPFLCLIYRLDKTKKHDSVLGE